MGWVKQSTSGTKIPLFGANTHFGIRGGYGNYWDTPLNQLLEIHGRIARDSMEWGQLERTQGVYSWDQSQHKAMEQFAARCKEENVALLVCFSGPNTAVYPGAAYPDFGEEGCTAFANAAVEVVRHLDLKHISIYNEWPEMDTSYNGYRDLLAASYAAIKAYDPKVTVWAGEFIDPYWPGGYKHWCYTLMNETDWLDHQDGALMHVYSDGALTLEQPTPEALYANCKIVTDANGSQIQRFALTEAGYASGGPYPLNDAQLAEYYSRSVMLLACLPIDYFTWYELRDYSSGQRGLWKDTATPKGSVPVVRDAHWHLWQSSARAYYLDEDTGVHAYRMNVGAGHRVGLSAPAGPTEVRLNVVAPRDGADLKLHKLGAESNTQTLHEGNNIIELMIEPTTRVLWSEQDLIFPAFVA